jgi:hypothetical protein
VLQLQSELERLRNKLAKADLIIDVKKQLSILLGPSPPDTTGEPQ